MRHKEEWGDYVMPRKRKEKRLGKKRKLKANSQKGNGRKQGAGMRRKSGINGKIMENERNILYKI